MSAVIAETTTAWNKETKQTDVHITLYNTPLEHVRTRCLSIGQNVKVRQWLETNSVVERSHGRMGMET